MKELCSVLVSSCDKYEDAWLPFFTFFKQSWCNCPYPVYLNTETKQYHDNSVPVHMLNYTAGSWSSRLKKALQAIKTKYVILLLEDFFLLDKVNEEAVSESIALMQKDKRIAVIDFSLDKKSAGKPYPSNGNFCERARSSLYFLNCQAAIWRRRDLIKFLSPYESPWQFELFGSRRVHLYRKTFLLRNYRSDCVFHYSFNINTGYGIYRGKWLRSNIKLFEDHHITTDFERLGFYNPETDAAAVTPPDPPKTTLGFRLRYLVFGGETIDTRMSIPSQLRCFVKSPKQYLRLLKTKLYKVKHDCMF